MLEYLQNKPVYSSVIYIDEAGFSLSMRRSFGRSLSGTKANLKVKSIRSKNITLIAAISAEKVWTFHLENGPVNQDIFYNYISKLFNDLTNDGVQRALLVMDNVRFHKTNLIAQLIESSSHKLLFLPPYSPFLNPIEEFFHQVKTIVRSKSPQNFDQLTSAIMESPNDVSANHLNNYVNHSESYFARCINMEEIDN